MIDTNVYNADDVKYLAEYMHEVPFQVFRKELYSCFDLFDVFDPNDSSSFERCYDTRVFKHLVKKGKQPVSQREACSRSVHDTCIWNSMQELLNQYSKTQVVGIMGGHAMLRTDMAYRKTLEISKSLTEQGCLIISGGGPGAMEASHLGAWMAGRTSEEVDQALSILAPAPCFRDEGWLATAFEVLRRFPQSHYKSLSIPTWYYGHEPPTIFATHIAKFFYNSVREDSILSEAGGGIIYMPGSAGTLQEIFQEAVQDHYLSFGYSSPMIFVGKDYWTDEMPVWPFIQQLVSKGKYKNLILDLLDETHDIVRVILEFQEKHNSSINHQVRLEKSNIK